MLHDIHCLDQIRDMTNKQHQKIQREHEVLFGLIELYLQNGNPVGSNTLKQYGFDHISSATIRNYFSKLEKKGLLNQEHSSAGRVPTQQAFKLYANKHLNSININPKRYKFLKERLDQDVKEIAAYLQFSSELLSDMTQGAVFICSPRFDQDIIVSIKLVAIDHQRCLAVIITDFGMLHTEILYTPKKLNSFSVKRLESYFKFRLTGVAKPSLNQEEEEIGTTFYNEILVRHIVNYSNFSEDDVYKTGFSKLIHFPEFHSATKLASSLSIFENNALMRGLLNASIKESKLKVWIGDEIKTGELKNGNTSIIAMPYFIHGKAVGAIALLGPIRLPYPRIFGLVNAFSKIISETLTRNLYKYKITYRKPAVKQIDQKYEPPKLIE